MKEILDDPVDDVIAMPVDLRVLHPGYHARLADQVIVRGGDETGRARMFDDGCVGLDDPGMLALRLVVRALNPQARRRRPHHRRNLRCAFPSSPPRCC